jgi:hypothetical protein
MCDIIYFKQVDNYKNIIKEKLARKEKGNCVVDSYITFQKLYKIGSKRVRGRINNKDMFMNDINNTSDQVHYWTEANNYVYDISEHQKLIMPIDEFYQMFEISHVEYAEYGIFNKNNFELNSGPDIDAIINKHLLQMFLIDNK